MEIQHQWRCVCVCVWSWKKQKQKPCGDFFGVISRFSFSGPQRLRERWRWLKCQTNFRPPSSRRDPVTLARTGSRQGPSDKHFKLIWIYFNNVCFIPSPDKTPEFILLHLRSHGLMNSKIPKIHLLIKRGRGNSLDVLRKPEERLRTRFSSSPKTPSVVSRQVSGTMKMQNTSS